MSATPPDLSGPAVATVIAYHQRTKHHPHGYARSLGYLDWDTQPDPFRRYQGSELLLLDEVPPTPVPLYDEIFGRRATQPRPVDRVSLSQLFYDSLAISAWKELGSARWSLRVNPSSGALHPTEGYLLAGPVPGLSDSPALYHYSPFDHGLERRGRLPRHAWSELGRELPPGALVVGLTSIHWRESWKYGERAFRYCHHDVGHAVGAVILAASVLGWKARLLEGWDDRELAVVLGVATQRGHEAEHPDCLIGIDPAGRTSPRDPRPSGDLLARLDEIEWSGEPNRLSSVHHAWPVIDEVAEACVRTGPPPTSYGESPREGAPRSLDTPARRIPARRIIRRRRSAVALDGRTGLRRDTFFGMLARVLAGAGRVPFDSLPWRPSIHLVLFVHRVEDLDPGLYALVRDARARDELKAAMHPEFEWSSPAGCPEQLPLFRLERADCRGAARTVSCHQEIASDGAFAVAMIAEFEAPLRDYGAWFYKRLHWEAGLIGQVLYLEAEAAGVRSTGIGCFFDDALHRVVGLSGTRFQDVYHFTVGGAVDDPRLRTLPSYGHRKGSSSTGR